MVIGYDKHTPVPAMEWIDYGLGGMESAVLDRVPSSERDLAQLYKSLAATGGLLGVEAGERFYEIGTPAALAEADAFLRSQAHRGMSSARARQAR